jgi:hypothetical protein
VEHWRAFLQTEVANLKQSVQILTKYFIKWQIQHKRDIFSKVGHVCE